MWLLFLGLSQKCFTSLNRAVIIGNLSIFNLAQSGLSCHITKYSRTFIKYLVVKPTNVKIERILNEEGWCFLFLIFSVVLKIFKLKEMTSEMLSCALRHL